MNEYRYSDHGNNDAILFIAVTEEIGTADKWFKEAIGYDVTKKPNIGCEISFDVKEEDYV